MRVFFDQYPRRLHQRGSCPVIAGMGNVAHPDMPSTGVLRRGKAQVGCKLIGTQKTSGVLDLNQDFYSAQFPNAGYGLDGLCASGIFLLSAKLNDLMGKSLFSYAQVVKKSNQDLKRSVQIFIAKLNSMKPSDKRACSLLTALEKNLGTVK